MSRGVRPEGFLPVTTFGGEFPLDEVIRPFLTRHAKALMVSFHYARAISPRFTPPLFIDSGGFAVLLPGARIVESEDGLGVIERDDPESGGVVTTHPDEVMALQARHARFGCPLDFPIPPGLEDPAERERRQRLTLANARHALGLDRPAGLGLFGPVQGWDVESYLKCAEALLAMGYEHLAIGGLVPRLGDQALVEGIVRGVRGLQQEDAGLHLFGVGKPEFIAAALGWGATSTDSSSYVRAAASGISWDGAELPDDPSALERAHVAIGNAAVCARAALR